MAAKSGSYFNGFNTITYSNTLAIDLTERVVVLTKPILANPYVYYPQDIVGRADTVALNDFNNPYYSWILYLGNNIIDPYYGWYLSPEQFDEFIQIKYGSFQLAMTKIAYFTNNWVDQPNLFPADFEALSPDSKKYWQPNIDYYGNIFSYSRIQEDWITTTNYIVELNLLGTNTFTQDEVVYISYGDVLDSNNNPVPSSNGQAQVLAQVQNSVSNTTTLMIQHLLLTGSVLTNDPQNTNVLGTITGSESGSIASVVNATYVANNIDADSLSYWIPVYYYDMENERNEAKKTIDVLKSQYVPNFVQNVNKLLANTSF